MDKVERHKHESYGCIRASRVQGGANLFDSSVSHQHYVEITIARAESETRFGSSYVFGREDLITVAMSEGQFATFITSMNVGSGAPCTLGRINGKLVPPPPVEKNFRQTYSKEIADAAEAVGGEIENAMTAVRDLMAKGKAGKSDLAAVMARLEAAERELTANLPFVMKQMATRIEGLVTEAKHDITGHAMMLSQSLGQAGALGGADDLLPQLAGSVDPE